MAWTTSTPVEYPHTYSNFASAFAVPGENGHTLRNGWKARARSRGFVPAKTICGNVCLLLFLYLLFTASGYAQSHPTRPPNVDGTVAPVDTDETRERLARDMAKKANVQRQAALKNDTDKLVKLADELKEYVDKSNESILSLDVMKKAEEIEKLARSVKEKMKGAN